MEYTLLLYNEYSCGRKSAMSPDMDACEPLRCSDC